MNVRENKKQVLYITPISFSDNEISYCTDYFQRLPDQGIFQYLPQNLAKSNPSETSMFRAYSKLEDAYEALEMSYELSAAQYRHFSHIMIAMVEVSPEILKNVISKQCHYVITDGRKKLEYASSDCAISQNQIITVYDDVPNLKLEIKDFLRLYHHPFRDKDSHKNEGYATYPTCPLTNLDMTDSDILSNRKKQLHENAVLILKSHEKADSEISRLQIELIDKSLQYLGKLLNIPQHEINEILEKAKNSLKKPEISINVMSTKLDGITLFQKTNTQCQATPESEKSSKRERCGIS